MHAKEISESIAYCGLVCKLCHLADDCSGSEEKVISLLLSGEKYR